MAQHIQARHAVAFLAKITQTNHYVDIVNLFSCTTKNCVLKTNESVVEFGVLTWESQPGTVLDSVGIVSKIVTAQT